MPKKKTMGANGEDDAMPLRAAWIGVSGFLLYVFAYAICLKEFFYSSNDTLHEELVVAVYLGVVLVAFSVIFRSLAPDAWGDQPFWKWVLPLVFFFVLFAELEGWSSVRNSKAALLVTSLKSLASTLVYVIPLVLVSRKRGYNFLDPGHRLTYVSSCDNATYRHVCNLVYFSQAPDSDPPPDFVVLQWLLEARLVCQHLDYTRRCSERVHVRDRRFDTHFRQEDT